MSCLVAVTIDTPCSLTEMSGHKVFLQDGEEIHEGLLCSYCKLVLKDPVQTSESGQRFCSKCYEILKASRNLQQGVWRDHAVEIEIAKLLVKCPYYIAGCSWRGRFRDSAEHETACEYQDVIASEPYETSVMIDLLSEQFEVCDRLQIIRASPFYVSVSVAIRPMPPFFNGIGFSQISYMVGGIQQFSTAIEDVRSLTHTGGHYLQYPPMDLSGFQGWVTTLLDQVFERIASVNDRINQLQESNASTYGGY